MKFRQLLFQNSLKFLRELDFKKQERTVLFLAILISKFRFEIPRRIRMLLVTLLPRNPLEFDEKPTIDAIIPLTQKDFLIVSYSIYGLMLNSQNKINSITLCVPTMHVLEFSKNYSNQIKSLVRSFGTTQVKILSDEEIIGSIDLNLMSLNLGNRTGWIIQQIIKIKASINSLTGKSLVLDADTVLLKPITFLNNSGKQILHVGTDRHMPYLNTLQKVWGFSPESFKLSFVTHFQLMQKMYLLDIYSSDDAGILKLIRGGDKNEPSMFSEYETYGKYMSLRQCDKVAFVRWDNTSADRSILLNMIWENHQNNYQELKKRYSSYGSVSFHSYLN